MLPGDRLVCAFVEPLAAGSRFAAWPLHVTVVPWFRVALSNDEILVGLQEAVAGIHPFTVIMDGDAHFGRRGQKPVSLVVLPSSLVGIERTVRRFLKAHGAWLVDETTKRRQTYRPHVTVQGNERLQHGDEFGCDKLYVVEQLGGAKTVSVLVELKR